MGHKKWNTLFIQTVRQGKGYKCGEMWKEDINLSGLRIWLRGKNFMRYRWIYLGHKTNVGTRQFWLYIAPFYVMASCGGAGHHWELLREDLSQGLKINKNSKVHNLRDIPHLVHLPDNVMASPESLDKRPRSHQRALHGRSDFTRYVAERPQLVDVFSHTGEVETVKSVLRVQHLERW